MFGKSFEGDRRIGGKQLLAIAVGTAVGLGTLGNSARVFAAETPRIFVGTVDELYDAVNNGAPGAAILLSPGRYTLSATDPHNNNLPRPNGGRLDLQLDMSLYNICVLTGCVEADRASVVIDAGARDGSGKRLLPVSSFAVPFGRTGVIRAGCGTNSIEWLTIAGNPAAAASIETELAATNETCRPLESTITVAHVVTSGSARGIDIRNVTDTMASHRIVAKMEHDDFSFSGEGIRVINFITADGGEITVHMRRNRSHGNVVGCVLENNRSNGASIVVKSYQDQLDDNQLGCTFGGGYVNNKSGQTANDSTTMFDATESQFMNNVRTSGFNTEAGTPEFTDKGGIVVSGGGVGAMGLPSTTNGNTAIVRLRDVEFADNVSSGGTDLLAFGARCEAAECKADGVIAGIHNHVLIQLRGLSASAEVVESPSEPPDPSGSNWVRIH